MTERMIQHRGHGTATDLENEKFAIAVDEQTGAVSSLVIKEIDCDLSGEKRLLANFRICLPLEDYLCHYLEGMHQTPVSVAKSNGHTITVRFSGLSSEKGEFPIDLSYTISLWEDQIRFRARLTNHCEQPISEFWFPRLGGWTRFGPDREAKLAAPGYLNCDHKISLFKNYPGSRGLGSEAAEWSLDYPGMTMPWWDIYDEKSNRGLYLGYHDQTFRYSTWHTYLFPTLSGRRDGWLTADEVGGDPVGLVFSHVRYPFIHSGETFDTGEFIIRFHEGDWHHGSKFYRQWFMEHFPFDKSKSWLRKQSAWFSSILLQPEDKIVADYVRYDQWCKEAREYGIDCYELLGWDKGGLERDYPQYVPEEKLGGWERFRKLLSSIRARGGRSLVFVNYNILDPNTKWYWEELHQYTHQDQFGKTPNWMAWGESTLMARKALSVRRHVLASVGPPFEEILEKHFLELVKAGADGFQIDKVCVGSALDFNPLNKAKPDVALCEGLVQAIGRLLEKCRNINPEFCLAAEALQDRLIPYVEVYYRTSSGFDISPLRYVFPEWTSCQHVSAPRDFNGINGAVLTGSVICVEPEMYQGSLAHPHYKSLARYLKEVERLRKELLDIIFLGRYCDTLDAKITEITEAKATDDVEGIEERRIGNEVIVSGDGIMLERLQFGPLQFRVHGLRETDRRAIVIANASRNPRKYHWAFLHSEVSSIQLYEPFEPVRTVPPGIPLEIRGEGLHILVECR